MINLILIAIMLALVWLVMRGVEPIYIKPADRRVMDFIELYNEFDDKTETLFDRRSTDD